MVKAFIYVEGGAAGENSKELTIRCREGFSKLPDRMGFTGRKPRLVACGGRGAVYDRFVTGHSNQVADYVAMWIDSEEPMSSWDAAWEHLQKVKTVPKWARPEGAEDEPVLFMTTCMETWIVADRDTLAGHYGNDLQQNALPPLDKLESRSRDQVQEQLMHATRDCSKACEKGKRSYNILGLLNPAVLEKRLPSFKRAKQVLDQKL